MRLILVRHGETEENKRGICQGQLPGHLTRKGISQAKKLAKRLAKDHFDIIYSSDLKRAKDTCKEITKYHPKTPVKYVKELRERHFGCFQGKTTEQRAAYIKRRKSTYEELVKKKGETRAQKDLRALNFFKIMIKRHPDETVLWVAHGGTIRPILAKAKGLKKSTHLDIQTHNASVNIVEVDKKGKHRLHLANCTKHL